MENLDQDIAVDATSFRLKSGYCHILPDKIVLSGDQNPSYLPPQAPNRIALALLFYLAVSGFLLFQAYEVYIHGQTALAIVLCAASLTLIYGIVLNRNNSTSNIIPRDKIRKVVFKQGSKGLTRTHVQVYFEDKDGKVKRRLLLLPGSLSGGDGETEKAVRILHTEGLIESPV